MTDNNTQHTPSPEFRASLERDVMQAFRRQSQFEAPPSMARRARLRTVATLLVGLMIGAGTAVATAQVQDAKVRDSLALAIDMKRRLAMLRLELAEASLQSALASVKAGARAADGAANAKADVLAAEIELKRVDLEAQESKITGAAARDELWVPLNGKVDFVTERLRLDAAIAQQQLQLTESAAEDARMRARVGAINPSDTLEASGLRLRALADLQLIAQKIQLRQSFLESKLNEAQISAQLQLLETRLTRARLYTKLLEARERSKRARELLKVGTSTLLDTKRAELEELELTVDVERLNTLLKRLEAQRPARNNE